MQAVTSSPAKRTPKRSEAAFHLARLGLTQRTIAEKCDVDVATVNRWMSGETKPRASVRQRMVKYYGIELVEWSRARGDGAPAVLRSLPPPDVTLDDTTWLRDQMRRIRTAIETDCEMTLSEKTDLGVKASKVIVAMNAELSEEGKAALFLGSRAWLAIKERVRDAVAGHPDAAAAVVKALDSFEPTR